MKALSFEIIVIVSTVKVLIWNINRKQKITADVERFDA